MYRTFYIHIYLSIDTGYFDILVTMNNDTINMGVQIAPWDIDIISLGYVPRRRAAELYGSSIFNFFKIPPYCI